MEVDYVNTTNGKPRLQKLTPEERKKLMDEGRCFRCRLKGHQSKDCPQKNQYPSNSAQTARTATTPQRKEKTNHPSTSTLIPDAPPSYDEDQMAGYIRAMTLEQKETFLTKIASSKGKKQQVVDDRDPESDEDF